MSKIGNPLNIEGETYKETEKAFEDDKSIQNHGQKKFISVLKKEWIPKIRCIGSVKKRMQTSLVLTYSGQSGRKPSWWQEHSWRRRSMD